MAIRALTDSADSPEQQGDRNGKAVNPLERAYTLLTPAIHQVNELLTQTFKSTVELIPEVSEHLIGSGGKRVRPVLLLLMAKAAKAEIEQGLDLAVATELFHNATLLHDDVVDRGELRRGVPAAPKVYGNSACVLVGDFLLSRGLNLIVNHGDIELVGELCRVLQAMAEGEVLQLVRSGHLAISLDDYQSIISGKTAGLFSFSCRAGAELGQGPKALSKSAAEFGQAFGMAFQITDDILDYTAAPETSGKDLANDLRQGKATLPLLFACEEDESLVELLEQVANNTASQSTSAEIIDRVVASSAVTRSLDEARRYSDTALSQLAAFEPGPATEILEEICTYVVNRAQ